MQEKKQSLISEQVRLENKYALQGQMSYLTQAKGRPAGETDYAKILYRKYIKPFAIVIEETLNKPRYARLYKDKLSSISLEAVAFITIHTVLDECTGTDKCTTQNISTKISKYIQTEMLIKDFKKQNPQYLQELEKTFKDTRTTSARHKSRVTTFTANKLGIDYSQWSATDAMSIGYLLLLLLCNNFEVCKIQMIQAVRKRTCYVQLREEFVAWAEKQLTELSKFKACKPPCIVPPRDWVAFDDGGYYSPEQQLTTKFVTTAPRHWKLYRKHFNKMPEVIQAVNTLQKTSWNINTQVLDVLKSVWQSGGRCLPSKQPLEIPSFGLAQGKDKKDMTEEELKAFKAWKNEVRDIYAAEKKRFGKSLAVARTISLAEDFKQYEELFFVYNTDFRGRVYAAAYGVSPQGADYSKALLEFSEGIPLTVQGEEWVKIHTANCYGIDKVSFEDRLRWVEDNKTFILNIAKDPYGNAEWQDADKPFQFLRACFEIYAIETLGSSHRSKLAVGVDGSCNGLQNFSALLRDPVGGMATNLVPTSKPNDIYQVVADKVTAKVTKDNTELGKELLAFGITRKLAKRPVMTLPYGSTKITCFKSICEHLEDKGFKGDITNAARYLTPILWSAIGDTVIAAVEAMTWLKETAGAISKKNKEIFWNSPTNFLVIQDKKKAAKSESCEIILYNKVFKIACNTDSDIMDVVHNKNGISPNFIHSMDAAHLIKTINKCSSVGIKHYACIHDDYGTYANDVSILNNILREEFIKLYTEYNILQDIYIYYTNLGIILKDIPSLGTLDIYQVKNSKYFFC